MQFDNTYGDASAATVSSTNVSAHEAWMAWTINNMWSATAGRQIWHLGNGLVVGSNDWKNTYGGNSHQDGIKVVASHSMGTTLLAYAKMQERSNDTPALADKDLWVFYNMLNVEKSTNLFKNLDVYAFWNRDRQSGNTLNTLTFGARADGMNGPWDYNVELAGQVTKHASARAVTGVTGTDDGKGFAGNLNVGHKYMAHHFAGEFGYFNSEWQDQVPSNHNKRGLADLFAQNNLTYFAVKTDWGWTDKVSSSVNGWWFMATKDTMGTVGGVTMSNGQRQAALEGDIVLNYKADKNLAIDLGYAVVKPQSAIKNVAGQDHTVSKLFLQGNMTF